MSIELASALNRLGTESAFTVLARSKEIGGTRQTNDPLRIGSTRF